jgi:hypothetical protein
MRFLRFQPKFGPTANAAKFAQNYPKLPKFAKICPKTKPWNSTKNQDFSIFQKKEFVRVEEALEHISTVWIFNPIFFHMLFLLSKNGLWMWISAYPLVEIYDFLKVPHLVWAWDFVDMYLPHPRTRIWSPPIHSYSIKWFFWPPKLWCTPWALGIFYFLSTLNFLILQTVWNECVRFGGHVNIQVSYKILQLEVLKKVLICTICLAFKKGCF